MSQYKPYPAYKDSGVEWLGKVPEHWEFRKLKYIARFSGGGTPSRDNLVYWNGDIPWVSPKDMKFEAIRGAEEAITVEGLQNSTTSLVPPGHILLVVRSGILKHTIPVAINEVEVALNQDMKALRLNPKECSSRFFLRWVQGFNDDLLQAWLKQGATVESIEQEFLADTIVPIPSVMEQQAIVAHLDRETARIDGLFGRKTRFIELLREKRQALITRAVTKGLDPNVKMKDSGVEWLGEVPEHWKVLPLKWELAFLTSGSRGWADHYADDGALFIRIGNLTRDSTRLDLSDTQRVAIPEGGTEGERTKVQPGDILFSITAYLGSVAIVPAELEPAYVSQHVALARLLRRSLHPSWAGYVAMSWVGKTYLESQGYGGTKVQLSLDDIANLVMTAPPFGEQLAITDFLESETTRIDTLISKTETSIALLRERRSALITAAVTGRIDLRDASAAQAVAPEYASA